MEIAYFILLNALGHLCFVGSRMTTTLFALQLGASAFTVGALVALFAVLPMLLSVTAGRLIDRLGPRRPVMLGLAVLACGATLPFLFPSVEILYVSSPLIGTSFIYEESPATPARDPLDDIALRNGNPVLVNGNWTPPAGARVRGVLPLAAPDAR